MAYLLYKLTEYITQFITNVNVSTKVWEWFPQTFRVVLLTQILSSPTQMVLWKSSYGGITSTSLTWAHPREGEGGGGCSIAIPPNPKARNLKVQIL